jgi:transposase-like protein
MHVGFKINTNCPQCSSECVIRYGHNYHGKQRFPCHFCGHQFVPDATSQPVSRETRALVERLLKERLVLATTARVAQLSERWLQYYVNQKL